jgi:hypothetical protein
MRDLFERTTLDGVKNERDAVHGIETIKLAVQATCSLAPHGASLGIRVVGSKFRDNFDDGYASPFARQVTIRHAYRAPIDPGGERRLATKGFQRTKYREERVLDEIVDMDVGAQDAEEGRMNPADFAVKQLALCSAVPGEASLHQGQIVPPNVARRDNFQLLHAHPALSAA